jgi:hypothetical protein
MASRLKLQNELETLNGNKNVYYNPPASLNMSYPAIRYSKSRINSRFADNAAYTFTHCYEIIVINKRPDSPVIDKLLQMPYCTHDRTYTADNLYHDVFTLYY